MGHDVQLFDDLDAVAADARGALDRAAQPILFDRLAWYRLTLAHCAPPGRPLIVRARDPEGTTAWLFLTIANGRAEALASWYTLSFDAVHHAEPNRHPGPVPGSAVPQKLRPGHGHDGGCRIPSGMTAEDVTGTSAACLGAIAHALRGGGVATVSLVPMAEGRARDLAAAFADRGWVPRLTAVSANWSIAIPKPDFAPYLAARPKKLRETIRRKGKEAPLAIAIHTRFDPTAWDAYEAVYTASWKPPEGSWPFLRALAEQEGAAGTLRLGIARDATGAPVAAQLWLTEHGTATIHKLAHVEAAKAGSPGTVLSAAMFRHAIEQDRVTRIDFGTGDEPYKADWMDHRAPLYRLDMADPRRLRGIAALARVRASALVRRLRRR